MWKYIVEIKLLYGQPWEELVLNIKALKNRFRNYGLWIAIFSFIPILADSLKVYDINIILPDNYDNLVRGLLSILVLAGILNNPTTENKGFGDDKEHRIKA